LPGNIDRRALYASADKAVMPADMLDCLDLVGQLDDGRPQFGRASRVVAVLFSGHCICAPERRHRWSRTILSRAGRLPGPRRRGLEKSPQIGAGLS
jgi:hypothetical protein